MSVRVETERAERLRRDRIEQSKRQWTAGDDSTTCLTNSNYGMQCDDSTSQESTSSTLKVNVFTSTAHLAIFYLYNATLQIKLFSL